jgi:hypothetical protein
MFGIGLAELLVLAVIGAMLIGGIVGAVLLVRAMTRPRDRR